MDDIVLLKEIFKRVRTRGFHVSSSNPLSVKTRDVDSAESLCRLLYDMGFNERVDFSYIVHRKSIPVEWEFKIILPCES